jgi:UDP-glucose 4-epimerase
MCKNVHLYQGDIRDMADFRERHDIVYHFAAFNKANSDNSADTLFDINVNGTRAVMHYCRRRGARCVFASSSAVYGPTAPGELLREDSPLKPTSLYGKTKMQAESACEYYAENFGVPVIALRLFNVYGTGQKTPFIVPYIMQQLSRNEPVILKTPDAVRDFVYIEDVVKALILSGNCRHKGFLALNVGTGHGSSIYDLAKKLVARIGVKPGIEREMKEIPKDCAIADLNNVSKVLNWVPSVLLDEGLELVIRSK